MTASWGIYMTPTLKNAGFGAGILLLATTGTSFAADQIAEQAEQNQPEQVAVQLEQIDVTEERDQAGFLEKKPSSLLFGFKKPLSKTPRSATFVSDDTVEAFGATTVNDLISLAPGTFTASFYGVEGALNIRGTLAETYFHGFKRIENRGTYQTPIGASSRIDILRGPPTANTGPGKVGGYLNLEPKTAKLNEQGGFLSEITGEVTGTFGSYNKSNGTFQVGIPLTVGKADGGVYFYGELEDSGSYYRGITPEHQLVQVTSDFDANNGWTFGGGVMIYTAKGYVQTPGWNRLTQDLIDNGTYTTGQNTGLTDTNGNGYLDRSELPNDGAGLELTSYPQCFGGCDVAPVYLTLDTGVGTTTLSGRDVHISDADYSDTTTLTLFGDVIHEMEDGSQLKIQGFFDYLDNERFVSYGFPADYKAFTVEGRLSYLFDVNFADAPITLRNNIGVSNRYYDVTAKESFNYGGIAIDRRDISAGASPTDILGSPFQAGSGYAWDLDRDTQWNDLGIFAITDIEFYDFATLTLSGRYDWYSIESTENGALCFCSVTDASADEGEFTYSAMLMFDTGLGLRPYITYADTAAIEFSQAGEVSPTLIADNNWISKGDLIEVGVKVDLIDGILSGGVAAYRQHRTKLGRTTVNNTVGEGVEVELTYLATKNMSFRLAANAQQTKFEDGFDDFYYFPPSAFGLSGANNYGGALAGFKFSDLAGITGNSYYAGAIEDRRIPEVVASLYGTYKSDPTDWGFYGGTAGVTYVSETAGLAAEPVTYPNYYLVNASAFADLYDWKVSLNVDNLFDETYFTPVADLYSDVAALPGKGREWRVTMAYRF